jgi:hypothetical protein
VPLVRVSARVGIAALSVVISGLAAVSLPAAAEAVDPQVCVTANAPTAVTQPWYNFARSPNPFWGARDQLVGMVATVDTAAAELGPSSNKAEVDQVGLAIDRLRSWYTTFWYETDGHSTTEWDRLTSSLRLVDPAAVEVASKEVLDSYVAIVSPGLRAFVGENGLAEAYLDTYEHNVTATYPLTGPVSIPSSSAVIASVTATAQGVDQWHDLGNAHVVLTDTPTTSCATTAALTVPSAATTFGRETTVAISATRDGRASRGDLTVLLDGTQIGSDRQVSSYTATIPADLPAGRHVLTVAFAPVDGSPISTASSTVTVAKAKTTTSVKLSKAKVKHGKKVTATITVAVPGLALKANGVATVKVGKRTFKATITNGKGTVSLRKLKTGRYTLRAAYVGAASLAASTSAKARLKVTR